jgi:hypothetical protein
VSHRSGLVQDLRRSFADPKSVAEKLGMKVESRGAGYVLVRCPAHAERSGSCSLHARSGTLAVKCHGCDWSGDVLTLVAKVHGLDLRGAFADVLAVTAELAGRYDLLDEIRGVDASERRPAPPRLVQPELEPEPERDYPPAAEVEDLWNGCGSVAEDPDATQHLIGRRLDPAHVARLDFARVMHRQTATDRLPGWAKYRGVWWRDSGHRMLVRVWDADGICRSVRAWRVCDGTTPKRLPPAGFKAAGLVLANATGVRMLRGESGLVKVLVAEGEPDTLTWSTLAPSQAVIGILSGSWSEAFAARIPYGSELVIRTHLDAAGEKYAREIARTACSRAQVYRLSPTEDRHAG